MAGGGHGLIDVPWIMQNKSGSCLKASYSNKNTPCTWEHDVYLGRFQMVRGQEDLPLAPVRGAAE